MKKANFSPKKYSVGIEISRELAEDDPFFMHYFRGKHAGWHGRPYRRGINRCHWCGAPLNAPDDPHWFERKMYQQFNKIYTEHNRDIT